MSITNKYSDFCQILSERQPFIHDNNTFDLMCFYENWFENIYHAFNFKFFWVKIKTSPREGHVKYFYSSSNSSPDLQTVSWISENAEMKTSSETK